MTNETTINETLTETVDFDIEVAIDNYVNTKTNNKEVLQNILVYFFTEYEGKLSRNNKIFAKLMKSLDSERTQVLGWIREYTTLVSCKSDYSKMVSSDKEDIEIEGKTITLNRIHFKDNFYNQKWYEYKTPKADKDWTADDFRKAVENLKKKCEKNGIDYHSLLKI